MESGKVAIYQAEDGQTRVDVTFENETLWLSQRVMAELFDKDSDTIGLHIKNIFAEGELDEGSTTEVFSVVQKEGKRDVKREITHYNLDLILSVGYRVNSKRGTQFRIWANKVLKDFLIKGYSVNEKRLKEQARQLDALKQTLRLLNNITEAKALSSDEATGLLKVLTDYSYALDVLDKYDHRRLTIEATHQKEYFIITYEEAKNAIQRLKEKFGGSNLFGNEKYESFKSSITTIYQTYDSKVLYPSIEEKAAIPWIFQVV